jgi:hypothetical protein
MPKNQRRSQLLSIAFYGGLVLIGLSVRHRHFYTAEVFKEPAQASLGVETTENQQLESGKNKLNAMVVTRATYLLTQAQSTDNARAYLDTLRGKILGRLSAENSQRGGIWSGKAEDNSQAPLIVDSLAIELAMTWLETNQPNPQETYAMKDYLAAARAAGSTTGYDSAAIVPYLASLGAHIAPQTEVINENPNY